MYQWSPSVAGTPVTRPSDVDSLPSRGVSTLYIQTARTSGSTRLTDASVLRQFVSRAHVLGIFVVGWYLPNLEDLGSDLRRLTAMLDVGVDAVGVDAETTHFDPTTRTRRQVTLLRRLRDTVGGDVPVGAIVYPPLQLSMTPSIWPNYPWAEIAHTCDVILPMEYWTYRRSSTPYWDSGYRYATRNFEMLRDLAGRDGSSVHVIGGLASDLLRGQASGMCRAIAENGGLGGSMYEWHGTSSRTWSEMASLVV